MFFSGLWQYSFEIAGRVTLCPSRGDGVPENLAGDSPDPVCGLQRAPTFYPVKDRQKFRCLDLCNGTLSNPGEKIAFQAAHDCVGMARRPCGFEFGMPLTGYDLKGFCLLGLRLLLGLTDGSGVNSVCYLPPGIIPSPSSICKRDFGIYSQRKQFFLAIVPIL